MKIEISKKSMHYRFNRWMAKYDWQVDDIQTLCQYFWFSVRMVLKFVFWSALALFVISLPFIVVVATVLDAKDPAIVWQPLVLWVKDMAYYAQIPLYVILGAAGWACVVIAAATWWGIFWCLVKGFSWPYRKLTGCLKKKKPSIIGEYIKAKKENYCPIIEFKD